MDEEILWEIGNLSLRRSSTEVVELVVVSWTRKSSWEIGNLSLRRSSTEVVELVVISWTRKSSWKIGNMSLRAAELMSLSPSYSIRRAFYFNLTKKGWYSK